MKNIYTLLFVIILSPLSLFAAQNSGETVQTLFNQYDEKMTSEIPEKIKTLLVKDVKKSRKALSFTIEGFPFVYKWVGKKGVALTFNGHKISFKHLKSMKNLNRRFRQIMSSSKKTQSFSLLSWIIPQAHAMDTSPLTAILSALAGKNRQPEYGHFARKLFSGYDFTGDLNKFTSFLNLGTNMFAGNPMLEIPQGSANSFNHAPLPKYDLDVGSITVK